MIAGPLYIVGIGALAYSGTPASGRAALTFLSGQTVLAVTANSIFGLADLLTVPATLALFVALKESQ